MKQLPKGIPIPEIEEVYTYDPESKGLEQLQAIESLRSSLNLAIAKGYPDIAEGIQRIIQSLLKSVAHFCRCGIWWELDFDWNERFSHYSQELDNMPDCMTRFINRRN